MKQAFAAIAVSGALFAAGCAVSGAGPEAAARRDASPRPPAEGVVLGALTNAALPKGACGMVLWSLDEEKPAPVFRYLSGKAGEIFVDGKPVALERVDASGASAYGVFENQTFRAESGLKVDVAVHFSLGFDGGSYLERGLVTVETEDGWRTVAPSAGLAGCRGK